jgi:hypothetical protein
MSVVGRFVHDRTPFVSDAVKRMAALFFEPPEKEMLSALLNKPFDTLQFDVEEAQVLASRADTNFLQGTAMSEQNLHDAGYPLLQFYDYVLTFARVAADMRALEFQVRNIDNLGDFSSALDLQANIIHKDWYASWDDFTDNTYERVKDGRVPITHARWEGARYLREMIILSYPMLHDMVALGQGLWKVHVTTVPMTRTDGANTLVPEGAWCNAAIGKVEDKPYYTARVRGIKQTDIIKGLNTLANIRQDTQGPLQIGRIFGLFFGGPNDGDDDQEVVELQGKPLLEEGGAFSGYTTQSQPKSFLDTMKAMERATHGNRKHPIWASPRLARMYKESGVNAQLQRRYRSLQLNYFSALRGTPLGDVPGVASELRNNFKRGPNREYAAWCPPGQLPNFQDKAGNPILYRNAILPNGMLAPEVDPYKTECKLAVPGPDLLRKQMERDGISAPPRPLLGLSPMQALPEASKRDASQNRKSGGDDFNFMLRFLQDVERNSAPPASSAPITTGRFLQPVA